MSGRFWSELTSAEIADIGRAGGVALLPVSATEQHGPHLPVGTDAIINRAVLEAALPRLGAKTALVALPPLAYGASAEHAAFAGTASLKVPQLVALWTAIGESVARSGFGKFFLFNSHGGQSQLMELVGVDLRARLGLHVAWSSWGAFGLPPGLVGAEEAEFGIHAGQVETALMLHVAPETVRLDRLRHHRSSAQLLGQAHRRLATGRRAGLAWLAGDLNPSGAVGDATAATAAQGAAILDHAATALAELLDEFAAFQGFPSNTS